MSLVREELRWKGARESICIEDQCIRKLRNEVLYHLCSSLDCYIHEMARWAVHLVCMGDVRIV